MSFEAMTTGIGFWLLGPNPMEAEAALGRARLEVEVAEQRLSRFRPDSELSRLNSAAGDGPRLVSPLLLKVVLAALELARVSGGLVDPTVLPAMVRAGYGPGSAVGTIDYRAVEVDVDGRTVTLPRGVALDLGGVAKGWLADRIAAMLSPYGSVLVDIGGDLRALGSRLWPIAVDDPLRPGRRLLDFDLNRGGVATSSVARRRWGPDSHHLIDPRTGLPARTDLWQASVFAPTATAAEGAAKSVLLLGSEAGQAHLSQAGLLGILVGKDGRVIRT